jgi:hypothetical protein
MRAGVRNPFVQTDEALRERARLRNYGGDMHDSEKAAKEYTLSLGHKETDARYEPN